MNHGTEHGQIGDISSSQLSGFSGQKVTLIHNPKQQQTHGVLYLWLGKAGGQNFPVAGRGMPGWGCRGLVCQPLGFILLLKRMAAGHLPSGYQSNSLPCHLCKACWEVTWQPGHEGYKPGGWDGPQFRTEGTTKPKIQASPSASLYLVVSWK